jgi:Kynureninase (EC 3.7.1.3)
MTLAEIKSLDQADPLAAKREEFLLPEGVIYLDGNSLGALPKRVVARMAQVIQQGVPSSNS